MVAFELFISTGRLTVFAPSSTNSAMDDNESVRVRFVYGLNPVLEALRAHPEGIEKLFVAETRTNSSAVSEILARARDAGIRYQKVAKEQLIDFSEGGVHQGVVAQLQGYEYAELDELLEVAKTSGRPPLLVALDGIEDPHNLGAIIRSANAFGAHGVVIAKDRAAGITGTVAKASAGALEHCKISRVVNLSRALETLKESGIWVVAADQDSQQTLVEAKLGGPLVAVVGSEGHGIRPGVLKHCDFRVQIPMQGKLASLNASVSAAILLYEIARRRLAPA